MAWKRGALHPTNEVMPVTRGSASSRRDRESLTAEVFSREAFPSRLISTAKMSRAAFGIIMTLIRVNMKMPRPTATTPTATVRKACLKQKRSSAS